MSRLTQELDAASMAEIQAQVWAVRHDHLPGDMSFRKHSSHFRKGSPLIQSESDVYAIHPACKSRSYVYLNPALFNITNGGTYSALAFKQLTTVICQHARQC